MKCSYSIKCIFSDSSPSNLYNNEVFLVIDADVLKDYLEDSFLGKYEYSIATRRAQECVVPCLLDPKCLYLQVSPLSAIQHINCSYFSYGTQLIKKTHKVERFYIKCEDEENCSHLNSTNEQNNETHPTEETVVHTSTEDIESINHQEETSTSPFYDISSTASTSTKQDQTSSSHSTVDWDDMTSSSMHVKSSVDSTTNSIEDSTNSPSSYESSPTMTSTLPDLSTDILCSIRDTYYVYNVVDENGNVTHSYKTPAMIPFPNETQAARLSLLSNRCITTIPPLCSISYVNVSSDFSRFILNEDSGSIVLNSSSQCTIRSKESVQYNELRNLQGNDFVYLKIGDSISDYPNYVSTNIAFKAVN